MTKKEFFDEMDELWNNLDKNYIIYRDKKEGKSLTILSSPKFLERNKNVNVLMSTIFFDIYIWK